jgi:hypothetical protein
VSPIFGQKSSAEEVSKYFLKNVLFRLGLNIRLINMCYKNVQLIANFRILMVVIKLI